MRLIYTYRSSWIILIVLAVTVNIALAGGYASRHVDTIHKLTTTKSSYLRNGLHLSLPPLRPAVVSVQKINVARADDRLLNDVQVFPNPITDQINIKYTLSRNAIVTVKVMDVLGNDVITLISQRISSGEQNFSYPLNNRLQRGFYFIRVVAGTESVIKRISVL